jgi:hypothetical protein
MSPLRIGNKQRDESQLLNARSAVIASETGMVGSEVKDETNVPVGIAFEPDAALPLCFNAKSRVDANNSILAWPLIADICITRWLNIMYARRQILRHVCGIHSGSKLEPDDQPRTTATEGVSGVS